MAYGPHGDGRALAETLHESFFPQIVGMDPWQSEAIWQKLWARQRHLYNQSDSLVGVIDVAVWDLRGKMAQQPIAALLGQLTDKFPAYMSARSEAFTAEEIAAEATAAKAAGYHGYKLQLRDGPAKDIPRLRAAREAVGTGFRLMQDPTPPTAWWRRWTWDACWMSCSITGSRSRCRKRRLSITATSSPY